MAVGFPTRAHRGPFRFGPWALAMFGFFIACGLLTAFGDQETADAAGALGVFVGSAVSGTLFLLRARAFTGRERVGWSLIGGGLLVAATGVLTVAVLFFATGDAPTFGWPDLFFFTTYAFIIAGIGTLPHTHGSPLHRWRMVLDGLIGAVSIGALMWVFLLSDVIHEMETAPLMNRVIGGVYPFLDLVVFTVAVSVLLRRSAYRFDSRLALFTVGVVAQVFGDTVFLLSGAAGSFEDAEPIYALNLLAGAAFFATAYLLEDTPPAREYADRRTPLLVLVAPYIPAVGMLFVYLIGANWAAMDDENRVLLNAMIIVGLLVIVRQGVAIRENRTLVEQQRNTLVSSISHELRTPLTSIVGFVELLEQDDGSLAPEEQREMLEIVHQQVHYMSRIVSDLIMLARGDGSDMGLKVEPVRVDTLVGASIHASGVPPQSVTVDCPRDLVAFVDPDRMQQVIVNLLTNASRYGGPHRLVRVVAKGSDIAFEVHDDGDGIPRRYELTVWERFERGPNRLNASVPGSGIGLAIVDAIAHAHGGSARYRTSEILGGACFAVALPGRGATSRDDAGERSDQALAQRAVG